MITNSIQQARQRNAPDDLILSEILKQNPSIQQSISTAKIKGANSTAILDEIMKQNSGDTQQVKQDGINPLGNSTIGNVASGIAKTGWSWLKNMSSAG